MWQLLGGGYVDQRTASLALGMVDGNLTKGYLPLRFRFSGATDWRPLSFGVVVPVAEGESMGIPTGRVYPGREDVVVPLGPGVGDKFTGRIYYKLRNYNANWLRYGLPVAAFSMLVWVWLEGGVTDPVLEFKLFVDELGGRFVPGADRIGPKGAAPLTPYG